MKSNASPLKVTAPGPQSEYSNAEEAVDILLVVHDLLGILLDRPQPQWLLDKLLDLEEQLQPFIELERLQ